jgi:hypothetical protein
MAKSKDKKMGPIRAVTLNATKNPQDVPVCEGLTRLRSGYKRYRNYDGSKLVRELLELAIEIEDERLRKEEGTRKHRRAS